MAHELAIFKKFLEVSDQYSTFDKRKLDELFQKAWDAVLTIEPPDIPPRKDS